MQQSVKYFEIKRDADALYTVTKKSVFLIKIFWIKLSVFIFNDLYCFGEIEEKLLSVYFINNRFLFKILFSYHIYHMELLIFNGIIVVLKALKDDEIGI